MAEEYHLLALLNVETYVVEQDSAVLHGGLQVLNLQNLVARFALHLEDYAGILAGRGTDFIHIELLQHLLAACSLL